MLGVDADAGLGAVEHGAKLRCKEGRSECGQRDGGLLSHRGHGRLKDKGVFRWPMQQPIHIWTKALKRRWGSRYIRSMTGTKTNKCSECWIAC